MKKGLFKLFTLLFLTGLGFSFAVISVAAFGFESGNFPEGTTSKSTHTGTYGSYENQYQQYGYTRIGVTAFPQASATTSVTSGNNTQHVSASTGNSKSRLVNMGYSIRLYKYAGGLTN